MNVLQSKGKVLHLFGWDKKFVPPFIDFVREHFDDSEHFFVIYGHEIDGPMPTGHNVIHYSSLLKNLPALLRQIRVAHKVILHGLFSSHLLYALALQPWALKKCYWTIWGGDLYIHTKKDKGWRERKNEWFRRFVISRLGHFITYIKGDFNLARQWYRAKGEWHECFMYPSNLYKDYRIQSFAHGTINLLVGNSADPSNNHMEVLEKLRNYRGDGIRIYVPLSYGSHENAQAVMARGAEYFGEKFIPLTEFMPVEEYLNFLASIDIAIFNHERQQGMGNIISLLGLGKKVFMRTDVSSYKQMRDMSVGIFDLNKFNLSNIEPGVSRRNNEIISGYFSLENLSNQWRLIFVE